MRTTGDAAVHEYGCDEGPPQVTDSLFCRICREEIRVMIRKGTGICSELCSKFERNEISYPEWLDAKNDPSGYLTVKKGSS